MEAQMLTPDYIFESSWEVCNKVGGIYTVLSTRAKTLVDRLNDHLLFIGPDVWLGKQNPLFIEDESLYKDWKEHALLHDDLPLRIGHWDVPGTPVAVLVDYSGFYAEKDSIYTQAWNDFQVDSLHAYGDYDDASMFSYAAGRVVESFYRFYKLTEKDHVVYQAHEWMTGMGALYICKNVPQIATIFTTHATSIGRSIAGNNKPLYDYLSGYNGDQMACELNMQSKHSIEKQTAHHVDCFTTVSQITNRECKQLLEKPADVVLMNGFEDDFVPQGMTYDNKREKARATLLNVANKLLGTQLGDDTLIVTTSGRYEFKNKGQDVFIDALNRLNYDGRLEKNIVAFMMVPAWVYAPREDLIKRLDSNSPCTTPLEDPMLTHWLHEMGTDRAMSMIRSLGMHNSPSDKVKLIFVPCYLDGNDGIFNMTYYDLVLGNDLTIFPSYYEPWGYTPLESIAFSVPTITTDLAGFGLWVNSVLGREGKLIDGVEVIHRTDDNYNEVADRVKETIYEFSTWSVAEVVEARSAAKNMAEKALWKHFIAYYDEAYNFALKRVQARLK